MQTIKLVLYLLFIVIIIGLVYTGQCFVQYKKNKERLICVSKQLWLNHVYFTREYLLLAFSNPTAVASTAKRLIQNQSDIGNFFGVYYGQDVGTSVTNLLTEHINIAVDIVNIINKPVVDQASLTEKQLAWTTNANSISSSLLRIVQVDVTKCMTDHLATTTAELLDIKAGNYDQAIIDFDKVVHVVLDMATKIAMAIASHNSMLLSTKKTIPCCG